jgi:hypothetical protein
MTTIGKLNFFRWALETKILDYIKTSEDEIRTGYNTYLKETTQIQKRLKNETMSSTESNATMTTTVSDMSVMSNETLSGISTYTTATNTTRSTRRRRTKQTPSSLNKLQVYTTPIQLEFN